MHIERLQSARPLAAMSLSARAIQTSIETFLPSGTEDDDTATSKYWFWLFNLVLASLRTQAGKDEAYPAPT